MPVRRCALLLLCCAIGCAHPTRAASRDAPLPDNDPRIRSLLHGATEKERMEAMHELARMGAPAVPALARWMEDPTVDDDQGAWIAETLGDMGPDAAPAAPALSWRLAQGGSCSATTSWALACIGPAGVPWLVRALKNGRPQGRLWAAQALHSSGEGDEEAIAALVGALRDDVAEVRAAAAWTLASMDAATPGTREALRHAWQDSDENVREAARAALDKVEPD